MNRNLDTPALRLQAARFTLPGVTAEHDAHLTPWIDYFLSVDGPLQFEASLTADLQHLTWRAEGLAEDIIPALGDYFASAGTRKEEMDRLAAIGERLQPRRLGGWAETSGSGPDAGWYLTDPMPLNQAFEIAAASQALTHLRAWADEYGITTCDWLGRSVGAGNPFTEVRLTLPDADMMSAVQKALALFAKLKLPSPPNDALGALLNSAGPLGVSLWLTDSGVAKAGLLITKPPLSLTLDLCQAAANSQTDAIAAFQGMLGVKDPVQLEAQVRAGGFNVELHYRLSSERELLK